MELLEARSVRGSATDQEFEGMVPFLDVALVARLLLQYLRYALTLDIHLANKEHLGPLYRQLTRAIHSQARESRLYRL